LFHKGRELYGLFEARKALRHIDRVLIVEGYMDVIALAQFGIRYAVATLGTATTAEHLERLFRVSPELVFCFDGDQAGKDAAWKALNVALPTAREGREIRFLFLPEGEDPDSLVRTIGAEAFARLVGEARHLSDVFFDRLASGVDLQSLDGRARMAEQARPLLDRLPPGVYREMMTAHLSELVRLPASRLGLRSASPPRAQIAPRPRHRAPRTLRQWAIALLLQHPELAQHAESIPEHWRQLQDPGVKLLSDLLDLMRSQPNLKTASLSERWRGTETEKYINRLVCADLSGATAGPERELTDALERLNREAQQQRRTEVLAATYSPSQMSDEEKAKFRALFEDVPT
jgi:DNA primase